MKRKEQIIPYAGVIIWCWCDESDTSFIRLKDKVVLCCEKLQLWQVLMASLDGKSRLNSRRFDRDSLCQIEACIDRDQHRKSQMPLSLPPSPPHILSSLYHKIEISNISDLWFSLIFCYFLNWGQILFCSILFSFLNSCWYPYVVCDWLPPTTPPTQVLSW